MRKRRHYQKEPNYNNHQSKGESLDFSSVDEKGKQKNIISLSQV